jgi:hypothetical protein
LLKKDITYTDFNGEVTTETFYFHISQAELLRMEVSTAGGLQKALATMVAAEDGASIMTFIESFIKNSVGRKSPDGKRFDKNPEILNDFLSSNAYDTLFMELVTNPEQAADFLNGIVPAEMAANIERLSKLDQVKAAVADRTHPSDTAAKPAPEAMEGKMEKQEEKRKLHLDVVSDPSTGGNVFENPEEHRTLSPQEARDMDPEELRSGLAEGRYILGSE